MLVAVALAALRVAALALLFLLCAPLHLLTKAVDRPFALAAPVPRGAVAWLLGVRVRVEGAPAGPHTLLLPNHVSWLDILVVGGSTGCAFVSKDNLGNRSSTGSPTRTAPSTSAEPMSRAPRTRRSRLAKALEGDQPVALFPGRHGRARRLSLLPFRSTLLEAANYAAKDVDLRPVAIDYGPTAADIAWYQEPVLDNVLRVLGRKGGCRSTLRSARPARPRAATASSLPPRPARAIAARARLHVR